MEELLRRPKMKNVYEYKPNQTKKWYHPLSLWGVVYSIVWGDDLADSVKATLSPEEVGVCVSSHAPYQFT